MKQNLQKTIHQLLLVIALLVIGKAALAQAPTIISFSPNSGSIGTLVTIIGTNLNNLDTIKIGGVSAIKVSAKTDTLFAMVMPGAVTGSIYLKNSSGNVFSGSVIRIAANAYPSVQQGNKLVGTGVIANSIQGFSVSLSADGNTALIGGSLDNNYQGAAWVFTRSGGTWSQQGNKLVGTGNIGPAKQGTAVSISADGNTAIVGGPYDDSQEGAAWIFVRNGSVWSQQGSKLVGIGNIGAAAQSISVSLSADGNTALLGGVSDSFMCGAAWVFTRIGGVWSQQGGKLVGSGFIGSARQGRSVRLSADGNTAILGGNDDSVGLGAAWVFTRSSGVWSQQGNKLVGTGSVGHSQQGISVSLSADGNTALVSGNYDNNYTGAAWCYTRSSGIWSQQGNKLVGTGSVGAASQGVSVSLSADGNTAMVGGANDNSNQGAVWVYARVGNVWSQQGNKKVGTGSLGTSIYQGYSLSLSADGNTALVGGYGDNGSQGATWVFVSVLSNNANLNGMTLNSGTLSPVFNASTTSYSASTTATSISFTPTKAENNSTLQIRINGGTFIDATSGFPSIPLALNIGVNTIEVRVTAQDTVTSKTYTTTVTRFLTPTLTSFTPSSGPVGTLVTIIGTNLNFVDTIKIGNVAAIKVSIKNDTIVAMVMPGASTGNVYFVYGGGYTASNTNFTKVNSLPPNGQQGNKLVGTGNSGASQRGRSVRISADGNTAVVGGFADNNGIGAFWFYNRSGGVWSQQGNKRVGTGSIGQSHQGFSVSISADGNTAIIGAPWDSLSKGAAWIYSRSGGVWSQQGNKLVGTGSIGQSNQGFSVSLSADGNTAIIGGKNDNNNGQGAAWIFTRIGGVWSQQGSKLVGNGNSGQAQQGISVCLSADGNTAIVGGSNDNSAIGAAWVYTRNGGAWSQQGSKLVGTGYLGNPNQGNSVSLSADGNTAILGGFGDNTNIGAAWIFSRIGLVWNQQGSKLVGTNNIGSSYQGFSASLTADGNTAIVGGSGDNNSQGAAWLFTRNGTSWSQQGNKLVGTGGTSTVGQGNSVCISANGNTAIIGGDYDNNFQGAAWVFTTLPTKADLSALTCSSGILSPTFVAVTTAYSTSVTNATTNITVTPTRVDTSASIQVRINGGIFASVTSGNPSNPLALNVGSNTIDIRVTASDTVKTYSIIVTRLLAPTITSFTPVSGAIGTLVTITGTNLNNIDTMIIGGAPAIKVSASNTSLVVMVMPGTITGSIYIANAGGGATSGTNFTKISSVPPLAQLGNKLVGTSLVNGQQGVSVCISANGNTAIVGGFGDAANNNIGTQVTGAAWIYTLNGGIWSQQAKLVGTGSLGTYVYQGWSVSISADGNTAIMGAKGDNNGQGAAWIFTRNGTVWSQQGNKLVGSGYIGAAGQGYSVSLNADGNTAIVGGIFDNNYLGATWVFTRNNGVWSQQGDKLVGTGIFVTSVYQGSSVSLSADGNTAIVGGYYDNYGKGAAWIYTRNGGIWSQQGNKLVGTGGSIYNFQGTSVAISSDGNTAIVGGSYENSNQGAAWIYTRSGGIWSQQGNKLVGTGNIGAAEQGNSVSISADGNIAIIGGHYDDSQKGAAWVFSRSGGIWNQIGNKLIGSNIIGSTAAQGQSVSLSADGNTLIMGGVNDNNNLGAAWIFNGTPIISASSSMVAFSSCPNVASNSQNFTVSGTKLSSDSILISAPVGFEISKTIGNNYSSIIKLSPTLGVVSNTIIYVRISSLASGVLVGNIVCSAPNAISQNISISGTLLPKPNTGFTVNNQAQCFTGNNFIFNDTSNISSGLLTRNWNFGAGISDTSSIANPTKIYSNANTYQVKLLVTSNNGCKDSTIKTVTVNPQPNIGFTINNTTQCINENSFLFSDTSQISVGTLTRKWNFGRGNNDTSSLSTSSKIYSSANTYSIKLVSMSNNGCKDSISKTIVVNPSPNPGFIINAASQCLIGNNFLFTDTSTISSGTLNRKWNLGNGIYDTSELINLNKVYTTANSYFIKLISISNNGCKDSITKTIVVNPQPNVGFTINNSSQCLAGNNFLFTDTSSAIITRKWNFGLGNNDTSALTNPSKSYLTANTYSIKLVATNTNNCKDSITKTVTINPQPSSLVSAIGNTTFCVNESVQLKATTSTGQTYSWLKNESLISSNNDSNLVVSTQGTYKLITKNAFNCSDTSNGILVNVNPLPSVNFLINNPTQCISGNQFKFTDSSTISTGSLTRKWNFGEGISDTTSLSNPSKNYSTVNTYLVKLIETSNNNCKDSITKNVTVNASAIANFIINNAAQCLTGNSFAFTNNSTNSTTQTWNFGDASNSTVLSPNKTYNTAGNFTVKLVANNANNCPDSITKIVDVNAQPTIGTIAGNASPNSISSPFTYSVLSQSNSTYNWATTNGTIQSGQGTNSVNIIWNSAGTGNLKAKITNINNCTDSTILPINITVGTNNLSLDNDLNVYPNPTKSSITITNKNNLVGKKYIITNLIGQTVIIGKLNLDETIVNLETLQSGVYLLSIDGMNKQSIKVIKE
ncbi:MAG: PKD domain-containing protein [Bacteroidia bacterium]